MALARYLMTCGAANMDDEFLAGAGLNRIKRFMMDPRDMRSDGEWFEVVAGKDGVFGCIGLMACADVCPVKIDIPKVLLHLRGRATDQKGAKAEKGLFHPVRQEKRGLALLGWMFKGPKRYQFGLRWARRVQRF